MLILFFIIGSCTGSFMNVVIYRLPLMLLRDLRQEEIASQSSFTLLAPRSHCPQCRHTLAVWQLIPVLSWLLLRGHCHRCNCRIPLRYPLTELTVGMLFIGISSAWPDPVTALVLGMFIIALLTLAIIDVRHLLLPDAITLPLIWCGLIWNMTENSLVPLESAVLGAVAGYLSLWSVYWLYRVLRNKEGLGYGDFKLMAALGAWLGVSSINTILLAGSVIGCAGWFFFRRPQDDAVIPFGPALISAACLWLICQSPLMSDAMELISRMLPCILSSKKCIPIFHIWMAVIAQDLKA